MALDDELLLVRETEDATAAIIAALRPFSPVAQKRAVLHVVDRLWRDAPREKDAPAAPLKQHPVLANTDRARIVDILRAHPQRAIADVAREVYGTTEERDRAKVRSHLDQLKRRGLARAVEPGKWEITDPAGTVDREGGP